VSAEERAAGRSNIGFVLAFDSAEPVLAASFGPPKPTGEGGGLVRCPLDTRWEDPERALWIPLFSFDQFGDIRADGADGGDAPYVRDLGDSVSAEGWLSVYYVSCAPRAVTSFDVDVALFRPRMGADAAGGEGGRVRDYLSSGEAPLVALFALLAAIYSGLAATWAILCHRRKRAGGVRRIHGLMGALLVAKAATCFARSGRLALVNATGDDGGWGPAFYAVNGARALLFLPSSR